MSIKCSVEGVDKEMKLLEDKGRDRSSFENSRNCDLVALVLFRESK